MDSPNITDEQARKLLKEIKNNSNHRSSMIWIDDVDTNSDKVIGLEIVKDIICITIADYIESANTRTYNVIGQFAVDREALQSALDYLDIIES